MSLSDCRLNKLAAGGALAAGWGTAAGPEPRAPQALPHKPSELRMPALLPECHALEGALSLPLAQATVMTELVAALLAALPPATLVGSSALSGCVASGAYSGAPPSSEGPAALWKLRLLPRAVGPGCTAPQAPPALQHSWHTCARGRSDR